MSMRLVCSLANSSPICRNVCTAVRLATTPGFSLVSVPGSTLTCSASDCVTRLWSTWTRRVWGRRTHWEAEGVTTVVWAWSGSRKMPASLTSKVLLRAVSSTLASAWPSPSERTEIAGNRMPAETPRSSPMNWRCTSFTLSERLFTNFRRTFAPNPSCFPSSLFPCTSLTRFCWDSRVSRRAWMPRRISSTTSSGDLVLPEVRTTACTPQISITTFPVTKLAHGILTDKYLTFPCTTSTASTPRVEKRSSLTTSFSRTMSPPHTPTESFSVLIPLT
mmetsp:Transcript_41512/g.109290  ORF Transcript_41512/g.109290 Transcript_41512/m.109290 type:complete len:276 (-) Transcript_41512:61-888(-)